MGGGKETPRQKMVVSILSTDVTCNNFQGNIKHLLHWIIRLKVVLLMQFQWRHHWYLDSKYATLVQLVVKTTQRPKGSGLIGVKILYYETRKMCKFSARNLWMLVVLKMLQLN